MTIAAILALAVVAFAASAYAYLVYSPKPQMPSLSTEVQHATMRVGDRERSYLAYVPARLPSGAALVIVLHGSARIFADRNGITTAPEIARMEPQSQTIRPRSKSYLVGQGKADLPPLDGPRWRPCDPATGVTLSSALWEDNQCLGCSVSGDGVLCPVIWRPSRRTEVQRV